jgi:hypothetical protein
MENRLSIVKKLVLITFLFHFAVLFLVSQSYSLSQINDWEPVGFPQEEITMITKIVKAPGNPQSVYVCYSNGLVFKTDNALTEQPVWETGVNEYMEYMSSNHMVTGMVIHPEDPNTMYISFAGETYGWFLWKSNDGGSGWYPIVSASSAIYNISINPLDPDIMYMISNGRILASVNGGENWTSDAIDDPLNPPLEDTERISVIHFDPGNLAHVFVGTSSGNIFESEDVYANTIEWTKLDNKVNTDFPAKPIISIDSYKQDNAYKLCVSAGINGWYNDKSRNRIWMKDFNDKWVNIHNPDIPDFAVFNSINIHPYYDEVLYLSSYNKYALRSIDNGASWEIFSDADLINVELLYRDGDHGQVDNNQINLHIDLMNIGDVEFSLKDITIRYWYTADSESDQDYWIDYSDFNYSMINVDFQKIDHDDITDKRLATAGFCQVSFTDGFLGLGESTGEIQLRINKSDWSNYYEEDDPSYMVSDLYYVENEAITVYCKNQIIWGNEPAF